MKEYRSASQILFGYLPAQTVDLRGRVWRVKSWQSAIRHEFHDDALRRELRINAAPWKATGNDASLTDDLLRQRPIEVRILNRHAGVMVEPFPNVWLCRKCKRVLRNSASCVCGGTKRIQFPFVGYHECGASREPYLPLCEQHNQAAVFLPGTNSATEIRVSCPICKRVLRRGLGMPNCECGNGRMTFTVHRAASVYTPRTIAVVNPPSHEQMKQLHQAGGPSRALEWALEGMATQSFSDLPLTRRTFFGQLVAQGIGPELAETLTSQAVAAGQVAETSESSNTVLMADAQEQAESQAVTLAMAVAESRVRIGDLARRVSTESPLHERYTSQYPAAFRRAAVESVELIDRLPILMGAYAYTRGSSSPGESKLVPYREGRTYIVHGDINDAEALLVRLDPVRVANWLHRRGWDVCATTEERSARLNILAKAVVPNPGEELVSPTCGSDLLSLVHSMAHRFIRRTAFMAGIGRNGLSELLIPAHACFIIYSAGRGGFVLGGLQAMFETELDTLLTDVVTAEHRCALDPACSKGGGACVACLHVGEPSCRYFNRYLDRRTLWGTDGYLHMERVPLRT